MNTPARPTDTARWSFGFGHALASPYTDPAAFEKVRLLPGEHLVTDVCVAREHPALAERCEGGRKGMLVERGFAGSGVALIDHTVSLSPAQRPVQRTHNRAPANRSSKPLTFTLGEAAS